MCAEFSYAHFEWSFSTIYRYFQNQNISFVEQGAWKRVALLFNWATRHSIVCILLLCWYFNAMHWSAIGLLTKSATFFLAPNFINSVISQYNGKYGQWITTQNVCKKILHALHFKWTILIKYFSRYIRKCQTGTYFFGWVYIVGGVIKLASLKKIRRA